MQQFERAELEVQQYVEDQHMENSSLTFERGFGTTIGNAIRRIISCYARRRCIFNQN